jgi:hypothetical protein
MRFCLLDSDCSLNGQYKGAETTGELFSTRQTLFSCAYILHDGIPLFPAGKVGKCLPDLIYLRMYEDRFFDYHSYFETLFCSILLTHYKVSVLFLGLLDETRHYK